MATAKTKIELLVEAKVREALNDLKKTDAQIDNMAKSGGKLNNVFSGAGAALKTFVGALAVREVAQFAIETAKLADKANALRRSLNNLSQKEGTDTVKLMQDMKEATRGAVSDIELMQAATRGKFLGIDLKNMPVLFEFAARRANDTGESIDRMVESIVLGVGRKSPQILDNLGLQMKDLRDEVERLAKEQGTWKGQVDETLLSLHLQEAAVNIARRGIAESSEVVEDSALKLERLNAQWTNFKTVIGDLISGPIASGLTFLNEQLTGIASSMSMQGRLDRLRMELKGLEDQLARFQSGDKNFLEKISGFLGGTDEETIQMNIQLVKRQIAELEKALSEAGSGGRSAANVQNTLITGLSEKEIDKQKSIAQAISRMRLEELVAGAENEFQARMIALDEQYQMEQEQFKGNQEALDQLRATYEARRAALRQEIVDRNIEILRQRIEKEDQLMIEQFEREQALAQQKLQRQIELYRRIASQVGYTFVNLALDLSDAASTGREAWENFFKSLEQQILRFLASKAVNELLKFLGNLIFPGAGSILGGVGDILGFQHGGFIKGSPGGQLVRVGENLTDELILPLNKSGAPPLAALNPPSLTSAPGGVSSLIERVTNNNSEKVVRVVVESVAPELSRVRQHYVDVNRQILRQDNRYADQYLQTKKSQFEE